MDFDTWGPWAGVLVLIAFSYVAAKFWEWDEFLRKNGRR